jgi:hypothetical protein
MLLERSEDPNTLLQQPDATQLARRSQLGAPSSHPPFRRRHFFFLSPKQSTVEIFNSDK